MIAEGSNLILAETKEGFLTLCKQYVRLGAYLKQWVRETPHPVTNKVKNSVKQYMEMGEQLKYIGAGLDALGGDPVLEVPKEEPEKL